MTPKKKVLRRPPAYQVYASDLLANEGYVTLTAAGRGVFHSVCNQCWVNDTAPSDPAPLAVLIRIPQDDIEEVLPDLLKRGLVQPSPDDPDRLYVSELQDQMEEHKARRAQQAAAGEKGGMASAAQRSPSAPPSRRSSGRSSNRSSDRSSALSGVDSSGVESIGDEEKRKAVFKKEPLLPVSEGSTKPPFTPEQQEWRDEFCGALSDQFPPPHAPKEAIGANISQGR